MGTPYHETFHEINELGIHLAYYTVPGGYHPLHWHKEIELLYPLNGEADIQIEGRKLHLPKKRLTVIDSGSVHSTYTYSDTSMFICIHISKTYMEKYLPDISLYRIQCLPDEITDEQFTEYRRICEMLEDLTRIYIEDAAALHIESEGIIMQVLAHLIRYFSHRTSPGHLSFEHSGIDRIREVITYVENHYRSPVSLQDISDHLGLTKEYFCRFFKKNMGMSFLQYVNEVRISHVYQDLTRTDLPIYEIAEQNGFSNQKLFNQTFKRVYGCPPSKVRKRI